MATIARDAPPAALSAEMQSIARNYLGARQRAGSAWLETARYLAEARTAAKYGEWKIFLEATQTSADAADRLLAIHDQAERDPQYRLAVQNNFLNVSTAYELTTAPPAVRAQLLDGSEPPTRQQIRDAKQVAKLRAGAEFDQAELFEQAANPNYSDVAPPAAAAAPFWDTLTMAHPTAHLWTQVGPNEYHAACGIKAYHPLTGNTEAGHCSSCVRATWPQNQVKLPAAPVSDAQALDDAAMIADIRALAEPLDLQMIWEDGKVLLYWRGEEDEIEQMDMLSYGAALEWLKWEAPGIKRDMVPIESPAAPAPADSAESDRQAHIAKEARDAGRLERARSFVVAHEYAAARTVLDGVEVSTYARDQLLRQIARDAALAFHNDQRARLKNFSPAAMISQTTFTQALDHIEALLNFAVVE